MSLFKSDLWRLALQVVTFCTAALIAYWGEVSFVAAQVIILGVSAVMPVIIKRGQRWCAGLAWFMSIAILVPMFFSGRPFTLDYIHVLISGFIAIGLLPTFTRTTPDRGWNKLTFVWAFAASLMSLSVAYLENSSVANSFVAFHLNLAALLILVILCKLLFKVPGWAVQVANTAILFIIGLPIADLLVTSNFDRVQPSELSQKPYAYEQARQHPHAAERWSINYVEEMDRLKQHLYVSDSVLPFRLRPNSEYTLFGKKIRINSKGFRGPEFEMEKGDAFRIVTLGESTTFGLNAGNTPWPELLGEMSKEKFPDRHVEVINAGIPSCTLEHSVYRLEKEILPLKPDLIICYHGYNGFNLLNPVLPKITAPPPPKYHVRPLKLLGDCEYRVKMMVYASKVGAENTTASAVPANPLDTSYATAYRQLAQFARTNHIQLLVANFSMAVNEASNPDVIEFYRPGFPSVHRLIKVNTLHSQMVQQLAAKDSSICFVDTHPKLDGQHYKFIDLVHFNEEGEQQLASTFFTAITNLLGQANSH